MEINISQILGQSGESLGFGFEEDVSEIENFQSLIKFLSPVKVEGEAINFEENFKVEAKGAVKVQMPCDRCLEPVGFELEFDIDEIFSNTENSSEAEVFSGDVIDLKDVVCRGILSGIPMKILCRDDCKGLCPICGKNLNSGECDCRTDYIDPRFKDLRSLFKLDEEV
ncbi:MAG: DUF177 domain-containing protein [Firmicutes bacterium]|nr:DUF177 domain-containing protein [Bacillota bacterium]